ncbi:MAG: hypothetical protein ACI8P3_000014 [Saprospiraceae bacterium]|jgi:uncharacterized protein (TIGR02145 family)
MIDFLIQKIKMKNVFQIIGIAAIFLALLIPQSGYGQAKLKIGDSYKGGIVFQVNSNGTSGLICQTRDLGKMDWDAAVAVCKKLRNGWRLPTKDELESMYVNLHRKRRGGFEEDYYWSSTEEEDLVWDQNFDDGEPNSVEKLSNSDYVRAVKKVSFTKPKSKTKSNTNTKRPEKVKPPQKTKDKFSGKSGTFKDSRDRQTYKWVRLKDGKIWMAENLNYEIADSWCHQGTGNKDSGNISNCNKYGRLYTYIDAKKVCPGGWHLPSDREWKTLWEAYGKSSGTKAYKALMHSGPDNDRIGFSAQLGGERGSRGRYYTLGAHGNYWSSTEKDADNVWYYYFNKPGITLARYHRTKLDAISCRCILD